ncbi:Oidioi.mRNA.OKI2018_I69.chr2.g6244.t1.cds [Oikopleura dioica]|uniref:Oidioi.mRNA.OKI2018_I69.chr2.g6244.t1.cds n=1 Tax=Oikopleura dioica TaxID=34765 RepID=A0ABN7T9H9_OIKDI|nr:Oidioi.mRNA.OKI2018_I69.chr2.g6244.t1.cds [Oikopleura dioica]
MPTSLCSSSVIRRHPDYANSMTDMNSSQMHSQIPQALMHGPMPSLYQNFGAIRQNPTQQTYSAAYEGFSLPHFYVPMPVSIQPQQFTTPPMSSPTPPGPIDLSIPSSCSPSSYPINLPQTQCQFYPINLSPSGS